MIPTEILMVISLFVSCTTLFTFVRARRNEAMERGARQANLDNAMEKIMEAIKRMAEQIARQQADIDKLKLWLELLLQQHNNNHGQDIRR